MGMTWEQPDDSQHSVTFRELAEFVRQVTGGDFTELLEEKRFRCKTGLQWYTEADLIRMGPPGVHARRIMMSVNAALSA